MPWLLKRTQGHTKRSKPKRKVILIIIRFTMCTEFMSHRPVFCASEINNITGGSTTDIFHVCVNAHGCTLRRRLFFFYQCFEFKYCCWGWLLLIRKGKALLALTKRRIHDVCKHKASQMTNWCHWRQLLTGLCPKKKESKQKMSRVTKKNSRV